MTFTDYTYIMYNTQDGLTWWTWPLHFLMVRFVMPVVLASCKHSSLAAASTAYLAGSNYRSC
jgi:hypothetical protein